MEYLCRFNIVGDEKEFEGKLVLDDNSFRLYLVETIPFNQQIINEGTYEEIIKYHSEYWDRYNELFYSNNKIEGYIVSNNRFFGDDMYIDDMYISGKKAFIIGSYRVSQSSTKQRVNYIFLFDSIIILSESIDAMPGYYNNVNTEEVLHDSIVSEISWNYDFEYQLNFFRRKNMGFEINTLKRHSQVIFRRYLQDAYKIRDDDFQFDPEIEKYDISCFGNLNIDPWKLKKDQLNIGRLPLDCDVELSLKFDECICIDEAFKRVKCIVYFFNFILSDFNFPSQFRFLQDNNLFEIKNNYNNTSEFSRSNRPIIDQRDIVNIDGLIKEWIHNYDSFFRIPFELYKNSHNINNSFEDRFRCIITSLDSLFDRITPNKLKNIEQVDIWKDIENRIKKCIPEESPLLERVHNLNRVSLSDKISMLSEHFTELYESKIESEIRDAMKCQR